MHEDQKGENVVNVFFLKSSWSWNPNGIENNTSVICLGSISMDKKLLSHLVDFVCRGGGVRVNLLTKENLRRKFFFRYVKGWIKFQKFVKPGLILDTYCVCTQCSFWIFFKVLQKINSYAGCPKLCLKKKLS